MYAEVTRAHIDDKPLDISVAYARFVRLAHLRVQAYGYKWYRWYSRQQFREYPKVVPLKHRQKKRIESGPDAEYLIAPTLRAELRKVLGKCLTKKETNLRGRSHESYTPQEKDVRG